MVLVRRAASQSCTSLGKGEGNLCVELQEEAQKRKAGARKCISTILLFFELKSHEGQSHLQSWWVGLVAVVPGAKTAKLHPH